MKEDWNKILYKDAVYKISTSKQKLKQKEYLDNGKFPIIDQGKDLIGGYTNDKNKVLNCDLPVIVFGDHTKNVKLINFKFAPGADGTKVLNPSKYIVPEYISYLTQVLVYKIKDKGYARHYQHIEKEFLPLSPPPIQRAIVSKIETLFSDLDAGIANLKKAQEQLKIYRQAVLKKAFEGELTKEWREKRIGNYELGITNEKLPTAEELLQQIKEERQKHYDKQIEDWKKAVKTQDIASQPTSQQAPQQPKPKKPAKPKKPKELPPVQKNDIEKYGTIPSIWLWTRFGNITCKIGDIDHKMPKTVKNGIPYLSTGNLKKNGSIDFENAKIISEKDFDRLAMKIKPEKGDIIFPRYGTIGRNILIDFNKKFLVSYSCAIVKNIKNLMNEKYVYYYSISPTTKKEIKKYTVETTQANIGIASIENFVFPLCPIQEQHQIVQEIETRLSVCDKVEQSISESLEKAKALRQSILKKAFEGKLLSEAEIAQCKREPDYEPASVLLEKIKAEKMQDFASQPVSPRKSKKNKKRGK